MRGVSGTLVLVSGSCETQSAGEPVVDLPPCFRNVRGNKRVARVGHAEYFAPA